MIERNLFKAFTVFAGMWCLIGVVIHAAVIMNFREVFTTGMWRLLVFAALWWAVTIIAWKIRRALKKRSEAKEGKSTADYREKGITEIPVENGIFGRVVFQRDPSIDSIDVTDYKMEKPLGGHEISLTADVDGNDVSSVVWGLKYLYKNSEKILEGIYEYTLKCCGDCEERDRNGDPYTIEYVRQNFRLDSVFIQNYDSKLTISMMGSISGDDGKNMFDARNIIAEFDLTVGENQKKNPAAYSLTQ